MPLVILAGFGITEALPPHTLTANNSGYQIELSFGEPRITDTIVGGTTFSVVRINGCTYEGGVGQAASPVTYFDLAVNGDAKISVHTETAKTLSLSHPLFPMQIPIGGNDTVLPPFVYDQAWYQSEGAVKVPATLEKKYSIRNVQGAHFAVRPISYNPKTGKLIVRTSMVTEITCGTSTRSYDTPDPVAKALFMNLQSNSRFSDQPAAAGTKKYLIITADRYASNSDLARFVAFRKNSFDVKVVTAGSVGTTAAEFASYIQTESPAYVLLVGQMNDFPTTSYWSYYGYWGTAKSYLSYVDNGTGRPAIPLGLFFFRTDDALKNIVDKTIYTAQNPDKYATDLVCFSGVNASIDPSIPTDHIDRLFDRLETRYWKPLNLKTTKVYACSGPNQSDASTVVNAINKGVRFLNYNGHGLDCGWPFSQTTPNLMWGQSTEYRQTVDDFGKVTNTSYPFVLSAACLTGQFENTKPCWAEVWLGHKNLAAAFIGAEQTSSMNQHCMNYAFMDAMNKAGITRIGDMFVYALSAAYTIDVEDQTITPYDVQNDWGCQEYHLFGDPALETVSTGSTPILITNSNMIRRITTQISGSTLTIQNAGKGSVSLVTFLGKVIQTQVSASTHTFNLSALPKGVYIVNCSAGSVRIVW